MNTTYVNGAFPAGRPLMPSGRFADVVQTIKSSAPNSYAAAYIDPQYNQRLVPCADAVWCAQQIVSGRSRSEIVGSAMAGYVRKFSQEAYMSGNSLTSLTAISVLGCYSVRCTVLDNDMASEVAQCLRSAVSVGRLAQRHAASEVLSRYALHATENCDGGLLLGAMSALTDMVSVLREHRAKLDRNYGRLMVGTLRSLAQVSRYVGENTISADTVNALRQVIRMDEVGVVRDGAIRAMEVVRAEPEELSRGLVKPFGPILKDPLIKNLMG